MDAIRSMLNSVRKAKGLLREEEEKKTELIINKNTPQFGDIRTSQEEALVKTLGENVEFDDKALVYKSDIKDIILTAKITSLGLMFQFRYNDPSGDGCYIWAQELQLSESNLRTVGKVRDAFMNWKSNLLQNGDLMEKLHKAATEED